MDGTILIVDDDEDTAILLRDSLRKRGFDVDAVNSAQQCLEHLRTNPADVVVTDVQMSGMSGIDLCGGLRQRYPDLLPLVLTGQGGLETAIAAIRAKGWPIGDKKLGGDNAWQAWTADPSGIPIELMQYTAQSSHFTGAPCPVTW